MSKNHHRNCHEEVYDVAHEEQTDNCFLTKLEAKGGAKASAPEWESGGQRGRKKTRRSFWRQSHGVAEGRTPCTSWAGQTIPGEESFIVALCPDPPAREEREERDGKTRDREERERERRERER